MVDQRMERSLLAQCPTLMAVARIVMQFASSLGVTLGPGPRELVAVLV